MSSTGKTKEYLRISTQVYQSKYNIKYCEFTGKKFNSRSEVEFAHIHSVITNPELAIDINNGVIILKEIHKDMTKKQLHTYNKMYKYCETNGYSLAWA